MQQKVARRLPQPGYTATIIVVGLAGLVFCVGVLGLAGSWVVQQIR